VIDTRERQYGEQARRRNGGREEDINIECEADELNGSSAFFSTGGAGAAIMQAFLPILAV
jgi:hypothetical protein